MDSPILDASMISFYFLVTENVHMHICVSYYEYCIKLDLQISMNNMFICWLTQMCISICGFYCNTIMSYVIKFQ